jgi:hypothetical protein
MRVWAGDIVGFIVLAGLAAYWWRDYLRQRRAGAPGNAQRLRVWRLCGIGLFVIGLPWQFHGVPSLWEVLLLAVTLGAAPWIVVIASVALAAHRRYPGVVAGTPVLSGRKPHI